jgi:FAD/FMN-containing dehydrogenase
VVLADGTVVSRLGEVVKDNAGYDLKQLFIGSEGTLGVVSRAVLRLQPAPRERITAVLGCESLDQVLQALVLSRRLLGPALTSFEVMWRDFVVFVTGELGLGRDPFGGAAAFQVLVEVSCFDPDEARERARVEESLALVAEAMGSEQVVVAQSLKDAADLWRLRDASGEVARAMGDYLSFDISIPTSRLQVVLARIEAELEQVRPGMRKVTYGHLGDGNLHLLLACPPQAAEAVAERVYRLVAEAQGSISAEHGIGLAKREALARWRPAAELAVMGHIKRALDPQGLLSRGRVLVSDFPE